jgi:hypothetical protein
MLTGIDLTKITNEMLHANQTNLPGMTYYLHARHTLILPGWRIILHVRFTLIHPG